MDAVEFLGYVAMGLVSISFLMKDVFKLRLINTIGDICFVIYGALIESWPVAGLNFLLACVNIYYMWQMKKQKNAE